ncbi:tetratricopeptide repeat protein [soil metagenome]
MMPPMSAAEAVEDFRGRILRFDAGAEKILEAAAEYPDEPMVQLCAAMLHLYGQTVANDEATAGFLQVAERGGATEKYPEWLRALRYWLGRQYDAAASTLEGLTERDPGDLLAAKIAEYLYYIMGQQYSGPRYLAHMRRLERVHGGDADFLAMYSFANELCGNFSEARGLAERSIAIEPRNPWAEHTLSHVTIRQGDIQEGEKRLREFLPQAATCSRPVYSHTAWHLGLFAMERLDYVEALSVFHRHIWGIVPGMIGEQIDAIALLWRMEMAGAEVAKEWESVADQVELHVGECYMPFLSAHHAYALARAGRMDAAEMLLSTVVRQKDPVWQEVGRSAVRAAWSFGRNDWSAAVQHLEPVMPRITAVGGSDAQDDLFRQTYAVALALSGRRADARAYLAAFNGSKKPTALDQYFYSLT